MATTTILTHADCDGICAGSIALSVFPNAKVFFTKPVSLYKDLSRNLAEKLIICDIALSKRDAPNTLRAMKDSGADIYYFDHHPLPEGITEKQVKNVTKLYVHESNVSASELIYRHYQNELPKERVWQAIYGAIGDYTEDTPFVQERILNWDKTALYFEVSALIMGIKTDNFDSYDAKRRIIYTLAKGENPSDVNGLVMGAKEAVNREFDLYRIVKERAEVFGRIAFVKKVPGFGFRGASALFAATARDAPIGMCVNPKRNVLDVTVRTRDYKYKLNKIIEKAAESVNGSGGGLPSAAGARIPKGTFSAFIKKMNSLL
jgi:single-stranded-DNA-specific exonuclease